MKINWFSPAPETEMRELLAALARRAEVVVWGVAAGGLSYDPESMPWTKINAADITVYELGSAGERDDPIWRVYEQHPGIVILPDLNLQPRFVELVKRGALSSSDYLRLMNFHHPEHGRETGQAYLAGTCTLLDLSAECPLTGAALENALGVLVHDEEERSHLARATILPVGYATPLQSESYVTALLQLIAAAEATRLSEAAYWMAGRSARAMTPWFSDKNGRVLAPSLGRAISGLLGDPVSIR